MRRDFAGPVSEQVLSILKAHSGSAQSAAESVFQIVNPDLFDADPLSSPDPSGIQHSRNWMSFIGEHKNRMFPSPRLYH
jgi:hypothetical protein